MGSLFNLGSLSFPHHCPLPQITRVLLCLLACFRDLHTILAYSGPQDGGDNGSRKKSLFSLVHTDREPGTGYQITNSGTQPPLFVHLSFKSGSYLQ